MCWNGPSLSFSFIQLYLSLIFQPFKDSQSIQHDHFPVSTAKFFMWKASFWQSLVALHLSLLHNMGHQLGLHPQEVQHDHFPCVLMHVECVILTIVIVNPFMALQWTLHTRHIRRHPRKFGLSRMIKGERLRSLRLNSHDDDDDDDDSVMMVKERCTGNFENTANRINVLQS